MSLTPEQQAAALWGWAENSAVPVEERLQAALKAIAYYYKRVVESPEVHLTEEVGQPTYCKVYRNGVLVFYGRTFEPDVTKGRRET